MTADPTRMQALKQLWKQAFGDPDPVVDAFFDTAYAPARHMAIWENGVPVSALYWFDCTCQGKSFAYFYAVATNTAYRGKGYASTLLEQAHQHLSQKGYAGTILVPGEPKLFGFYAKFGYRIFSTVQEFTCAPSEEAAVLRSLNRTEYAQERKKRLPTGGVFQEAESLAFLQTQADFYCGNDFVLAATRQNDTLTVHELLGNAQAAPSIVRALNCSCGQFRVPGVDRDFAMYLPLQEDCPVPGWFGLALD